MPPLARLPLLILGFLGLFAGIGAGLARLGWSVPDVAASASAMHGPLMICAFFGVVISLERAVAIGRRWAYAGPLFAGLGGIATVAGAATVAPWLFLLGSLVLLAATVDVLRRQTAMFTFTLTLGALCWSTGNALWAQGATVHAVVPWWLAFLILTIAGERLELSRFLPPSPFARRAFAADPRRHRRRTAGHGDRMGRRRSSAEACSRWRSGSASRTSRGAPCAARGSRASSPCACCPATRGSRSAARSSSRPAGSRPARRRTTPRCTRSRWASSSRWCSGTRRSSSPPCCALPCRTTRRSTCRSRCCTCRSSCGSPAMRPRSSTGSASAAR